MLVRGYNKRVLLKYFNIIGRFPFEMNVTRTIRFSFSTRYKQNFQVVMVKNLFSAALSLLLVTWFSGCTDHSRQEITIKGSIDYSGSADIYFEKQPVHYKYAEKRMFEVPLTEEDTFEMTIPVDSLQVLQLHIGDDSYPVVAEPGGTLQVDIVRNHFPDSMYISGYPEAWNERYVDYLEEENRLQREIAAQLSAFRSAEPNNLLELYERRIDLAADYLENTPLDLYYHRTVGEYLVKRLQNIRYRRNEPGFDPEEERKQVLREAKAYDFFTFESLHAQRAGIRDFTHDFANTFGVEQRLEKEYGQDLMPYDVKRLGYATLDSARVSVLDHMEERKAKAYSKMHLIAERIGEMPLDTARASYEAFLREYEDFPEYAAFLETFYGQVKRVSPGQPAVPFAIPDKNGEIARMEDFRGKYVLLDFWASWCIPCLDEFPYMNELYRKYTRNQFDIVAISIGEDSLRWRQSLDRFQNPWPQLYAGNGFQQKTFQAYRGGGIPFYILVNPEGRIERYNDIRPSFNLDSVLDSLIHRQPES